MQNSLASPNEARTQAPVCTLRYARVASINLRDKNCAILHSGVVFFAEIAVGVPSELFAPRTVVDISQCRVIDTTALKYGRG
ncbi:unnamed protein product [Leptosia nina]|uniref:Uncharacterized protein n=1 Tax=Leptosia nina TaxID=320188 RepID=A0AAV1K2Z2_9NEOP